MKKFKVQKVCCTLSGVCIRLREKEKKMGNVKNVNNFASTPTHA